ncbi:MAG: Rv3235 family protein [Actinomycetota bacterium]|nr:Rv3235 family protein [Actinomycetota bacterium]
MAAPEPTDHQLRRVAYSIARMFMEIERGLRPPEHIERLLTKPAYLRFRRTPLPRRFPNSGPVLPTDIRGIHVSRHLPGQVTASMTCREQDDRWGAIVLHLRAPRRPGETWKADQLERLVNSRHELRRDPEMEGPPDLSERIRLVEGERTLAEGARGAASARLKELRQLPADEQDKPAMKALRQQRTFWSAKVKELDDEILGLKQTQLLRDQLGLLEVDDQTAKLSPEKLERVLGPKPTDGRRAQLWQVAADDIQAYRERWDVRDPHVALGAEPEDPEQRRHRERVAELLRTVAPQLRREGGTDRSLEVASASRARQDRGIGIEL